MSPSPSPSPHGLGLTKKKFLDSDSQKKKFWTGLGLTKKVWTRNRTRKKKMDSRKLLGLISIKFNESKVKKLLKKVGRLMSPSNANTK